jgi:UDP-N-acetylmuramoylalanine--D-glutamate ligase
MKKAVVQIKKAAILGFGREGQSVLRYLRGSPAWKGVNITILDKDAQVKTPRGVGKMAGSQYLETLTDFDIVFRSPGIPYTLPEIQKAKRKGVIISSATKIFFEEIRSLQATSYKPQARPIIVGITGTKGKGTTATLLYQILEATGKKVILAGNMGVPMLDELAKAKKVEIVVLELASFQLQDLKQSPDIAVVLHITPDHLDAHKDFEEYVESKRAIAAYQKKTDQVFYFGGNNWSEHIAYQSEGEKHLVEPERWKLFTQQDLAIHGKHMFANAVMAARVAGHLGAGDNAILKAVEAFKGTPYRLQFSRSIEVRPGIEIKFYNDSAGTNPETAAAAAKSFAEPVVLICGGKDKGLEYEPLRQGLLHSTVKHVVLYGENRDKIAAALGKQKPVELLGSDLTGVMRRALAVALNIADKEHHSVSVVFAPAAASFDMFTSYADRGAQFDAIVKKLKI